METVEDLLVRIKPRNKLRTRNSKRKNSLPPALRRRLLKLLNDALAPAVPYSGGTLKPCAKWLKTPRGQILTKPSSFWENDMGKLHTLRRAIQREPQKFIIKCGEISYTSGAWFKDGAWLPSNSLYYLTSYRRFVRSVLHHMRYYVEKWP